MMSKMQWFVLLCAYVIYLLLGATVFHEVEKRQEENMRTENRKERIEIEDLLVNHYVPSDDHSQDEIFDKLSGYCGKPLSANMSDIDPPYRWDYYHSLFFVITVVSTIGYGNLAPTTTFTRIFMIFYGIIGIPINGMVIITLGDFFGKSFLKLYDRWKTLRVQHALATLGLVGQIILYLIPGFTFFIFLPSIIIMFYERWDYDVAVAYAFVTLTTIGFGDYVAGTHENGYGNVLYTLYQIFLLFWIISGLGYIVMVLGFVSRGIRSKKMHAIEHKIAYNLKKTNHRIREELRSVVNEYLLMRVKRVYKEKFVYVPTKRQRSQSCPDLTIYRSITSIAHTRKRAISAHISLTPPEISRIQSDSDLVRIDKEETFKPSVAIVEPSKLLLRVVNALGHYDSLHSNENSSPNSGNSQLEGIDMFPSNEILASEKYNSGWSLGSHKKSFAPRVQRPRAASECKQPLSDNYNIHVNDLTWYGPPATKRLEELREQARCNNARCKTLPPLASTIQSPGFFARLKNTFKSSKDGEKSKNIDVERQEYFNPPVNKDYGNQAAAAAATAAAVTAPVDNNKVLEETSIADFIRALTAITISEEEPNLPCKRKLGTACLTPPDSNSQSNLSTISAQISNLRRSSVIPCPTMYDRRFSLATDRAPPPYSPTTGGSINVPSRILSRNRRFSLRPVPSPVQRRAAKFKPSFALDPDLKNESQNSTNT